MYFCDNGLKLPQPLAGQLPSPLSTIIFFVNRIARGAHPKNQASKFVAINFVDINEEGR